MYTNFTFCFSFWGLRPPVPWPGPHHVNPSIVKSWVRLWPVCLPVYSGTELYCLVMEARVRQRLAQGHSRQRSG